MDLQTSAFWLTGGIFFVFQSAVVWKLMRQARSADARAASGSRLEIVWTLVPASMITALALMLGGFTQGSWTDADRLQKPTPGLSLRWVGPEGTPRNP